MPFLWFFLILPYLICLLQVDYSSGVKCGPEHQSGLPTTRVTSIVFLVDETSFKEQSIYHSYMPQFMQNLIQHLQASCEVLQQQQFGLVVFGNESRVIYEINSTLNKQQKIDNFWKIEYTKSPNSRNIYTGLQTAFQLLESYGLNEKGRVIFLITHGDHKAGSPQPNELASKIKDKGIVIAGLGITTNLDFGALKQISSPEFAFQDTPKKGWMPNFLLAVYFEKLCFIPHIRPLVKLSSVMIMFDTVSWTDQERYLDVIKSTIKTIMCAINLCDQCGRPKYGIIQYSSAPLLLFGIDEDVSNYTTNQGCVPDIDTLIDDLQYEGEEERNTHLAINMAVKELGGRESHTNKAIFLITTGESANSKLTNQELERAVKQGIHVVTHALGHESNFSEYISTKKERITFIEDKPYGYPLDIITRTVLELCWLAPN